MKGRIFLVKLKLSFGYINVADANVADVNITAVNIAEANFAHVQIETRVLHTATPLYSI